MEILITGTNRGIGFELTKQYLAKGCNVTATCRNLESAHKLKELGRAYGENLTLRELDISSPNQIEKLSDDLLANNITLDLVLNNAGYLDRSNQSILDIDYFAAEKCFQVNSLGPLYLIHKLLPLMATRDESKIVIITSAMGSLTLEQTADWYGYRMSKAAANMLVVNLKQELRTDNIAIAAIHPGWVKTDMGTKLARDEVGKSVEGIISIVENLSLENTGGFFNFDGKLIQF